MAWKPMQQEKKWPKTMVKDSPYASTAGFKLGRALFYEPMLSKDSSISCASCHLSYTAFAHVDHPTSHGIENRIGRRNAPGLFNLKWRKFFHWDGGVLNLHAQAINPLTHPDEMGNSLENILTRLRQNPEYQKAFQAIYKQVDIQTWMLLDALQQFTVSLVSNNSYYDKVQRGEASLNSQQIKGQILFEQHCNACHEAPLFFSNRFENNGLAIIESDLGRFEITGNASDKGKFRVPTLRNISHSYPYMHDGRLRNLKAVLQHYAKQFDLTDNAQKDLIAFLKTLTDTTFLNNPEFQYHPLTFKP